MKRFRRWFFNGIILVSLLFAIASAIIWMRSYRGEDVSWYANAVPPAPYDSLDEIDASQGGLSIDIEEANTTVPDHQSRMPNFFFWVHGTQHEYPYFSDDFFESLSAHNIHFQSSGFQFIFVSNMMLHHKHVTLPLPFVFAVTSILPAIWLRRRLKGRYKIKEGIHCTTCGYDLRATPDKCPECGTAVVKPG